MSKFTLNHADGFWYAPPIDPQDELDYEADFSAALDAGDSIATVDWTCSPTGLVIVTAKNTHTALTATVWLKSATVGADPWTLTARVVTGAGRTISRSFKINAKQQ